MVGFNICKWVYEVNYKYNRDILRRINNKKYCDDDDLVNFVKFYYGWNICIMFLFWVFRWVGIEKIFYFLKNIIIYVKFIDIFLKI